MMAQVCHLEEVLVHLLHYVEQKLRDQVAQLRRQVNRCGSALPLVRAGLVEHLCAGDEPGSQRNSYRTQQVGKLTIQGHFVPLFYDLQ